MRWIIGHIREWLGLNGTAQQACKKLHRTPLHLESLEERATLSSSASLLDPASSAIQDFREQAETLGTFIRLASGRPHDGLSYSAAEELPSVSLSSSIVTTPALVAHEIPPALDLSIAWTGWDDWQ